MKAIRFLIIAAVWFGSVSGGLIASENKGAETIRLPGGPSGDITFRHRVHQGNVPDCGECHALFPQEPNGILESKKEGRIKNRQVMDGLCLKCHRQLKKEEKPTGPLSCRECHKKN